MAKTEAPVTTLKDQEATFLYKCRRCGAIEKGSNTAPSHASMVLLQTVCGMPHVMLPLINVHKCGDGGGGITDLVGYEVSV